MSYEIARREQKNDSGLARLGSHASWTGKTDYCNDNGVFTRSVDN